MNHFNEKNYKPKPYAPKKLALKYIYSKILTQLEKRKIKIQNYNGRL